MVGLDTAGSGAAAAGGLILLLLFLAIGGGLYFLPGIVASIRHAKNAMPVWIIDFFLGWSVVGWVVALAMAFGETREEAERPKYVVQAVPVASGPPASVTQVPQSEATPQPLATTLVSTQQTCPSCGQPSGAGRFCQNCGASLATPV